MLLAVVQETTEQIVPLLKDISWKGVIIAAEVVVGSTMQSFCIQCCEKCNLYEPWRL